MRRHIQLVDGLTPPVCVQFNLDKASECIIPIIETQICDISYSAPDDWYHMSKSALIKSSINILNANKTSFLFRPTAHSATNSSVSGARTVFSGSVKMFLIGKNNDLLFLILEDGIWGLELLAPSEIKRSTLIENSRQNILTLNKQEVKILTPLKSFHELVLK